VIPLPVALVTVITGWEFYPVIRESPEIIQVPSEFRKVPRLWNGKGMS
jgi:hypothetical protein